VWWTLVAFVVLAVLAAVRAADWSYGADTGTFVQLVLDAFGGMRDGVEHGTHYRFHWSPALALLWPFLATTHSLWVLQALLAAATVACAPLLAAIAGPRLGERLAERCGFVALVYPPLVAVGFGEFRDLGLLPVLALGWWLALERRAWGWLALTALLLAGLREDVCLELALLGAGLGIVAALHGDRAGALAAFGSGAVGVASLAVYLLVVLPRVGPWPPSHFYDYPFAHGPLALLAAPFVRPLAFVTALATVGRVTYLAEALVPLALVPLGAPLLWLAAPGFAIVLLANSGLVWRMGMHYAALWIPWLLIAFVGGLAALRAPQRWATAALVLSAIVLVAFSPLHPAHYLRPSYHDLAAARAAVARVPPGASVATHDEWYTAISATHPGATVFGEDPPAATYLAFAEDFPSAPFRGIVLPRLRALVAREHYRLVFHRGAVAVYEAPERPKSKLAP
jgi:uncharacterized membrane protein